MSQQSDTLPTTSGVKFDPKGDNGLVLSSIYIPQELLGEIFCYVDLAALLNLQLVCRRWQNIIQKYVWRKKAKILFGQLLQSMKDLPWRAYYHLCVGKLFGRNLLKNHSGQNGLDKSWRQTFRGGKGWKVENPPVGVPPLPDDPVFEGNKSCFVTSYCKCSKRQTVDLIAEGFNAQFLDHVQPPIMVGEWYSARRDCPAYYNMVVALLNKAGTCMVRYKFSMLMDGDNQNKWFNVSHEFKNYGPGLRKIVFKHSGADNQFCIGHYGSKMSGASVVFKVPQEPSRITVPRAISPDSDPYGDDDFKDIPIDNDKSDEEAGWYLDSADGEHM